MDREVIPSPFDRDYFECGVVTGVSRYMNYSWMPELTLRMAHYFVTQLPIARGETVLDFGCAKGFLVKALRLLDVEAFGADISAYAIAEADGAVRADCRLIRGVEDPDLFERAYDWMIAKDVLEHIAEPDLARLLPYAAAHARRMFAILPLAADDDRGGYIVPDYDRDTTHVIAKTAAWWTRLFEAHGWRQDRMTLDFPGCKENWTSRWPEGNGFFVLESMRFGSAV